MSLSTGRRPSQASARTARRVDVYPASSGCSQPPSGAKTGPLLAAPLSSSIPTSSYADSTFAPSMTLGSLGSTSTMRPSSGRASSRIE